MTLSSLVYVDFLRIFKNLPFLFYVVIRTFTSLNFILGFVMPSQKKKKIPVTLQCQVTKIQTCTLKI